MVALFQLPPELLFDILRLAADAEDVAAQIRILLGVAQTCQALRLFVAANDLLWRKAAVTLGIPASSALDDLLYPGSPAGAERRWLNVVKLIRGWERPFPGAVRRARSPPLGRRPRRSSSPNPPLCNPAHLALPPLRRAARSLPRRAQAVEMCLAGAGAGAEYAAENAVAAHGGRVFFSARTGSGPTAAHGVLQPAPVAMCAAAAGDDALGVPGYSAIVDGAGLFSIVQHDITAPQRLLYRWNTQRRAVHQFRSFADMLVVLHQAPGRPHPSVLVCLQAPAPSPSACPSASPAASSAASVPARVVWECDVYTAWPDGDARYTRIHDFQVNNAHLVCLVGRYFDPLCTKLNSSHLRVLELRPTRWMPVLAGAGSAPAAAAAAAAAAEATTAAAAAARHPAVLREHTMPSALSSHPGIRRRGAQTTAFSHALLLTDTFAVSGGFGGELLVWQYAGRGLLYAIPLSCPDAKSSPFLRTWTAVALSADGCRLGAATSDQLCVVDMVGKRAVARWASGRRVPDKALHVRNPADGWPAGLWVVCRDGAGDEVACYLRDDGGRLAEGAGGGDGDGAGGWGMGQAVLAWEAVLELVGNGMWLLAVVVLLLAVVLGGGKQLWEALVRACG